MKNKEERGNTLPKYLKALHAAHKSGKITTSECNMIQAFLAEISSQRGIIGISMSRKSTIATALIMFRGYLADEYAQTTTEKVFAAIELYKNKTVHTMGTQKTYLTAVKQFLMWLVDTEQNTYLKPTRIAKIRTNLPVDLKSEKDILTGDELERMFKAMKNIRDRAFIEVLYDSMGRIGEVCRLKWSQIEFFDSHAVITVQSKTRIERKIPLLTSHITLKLWRHQYPQGACDDDCVFFGRVSTKEKPMSYGTALKMITDATKAAGIEKRVTPHTFRHTRITDLMRIGAIEQHIKMLAWGSTSTAMLKVYSHLTPTDAVNGLLRTMGIETDQKMKPLADMVTPAQCPRCGIINSKLNPYCGICGSAMAKTIEEEYG